MNRLANRVERLEGGRNPEEVSIWGHYPLGCTDERFREIAEATAKRHGYEPPYRIDAQCSNLPGGEDEIRVIVFGTDAELRALLKEVSNARRLIHDRDGHQAVGADIRS